MRNARTLKKRNGPEEGTNLWTGCRNDSVSVRQRHRGENRPDVVKRCLKSKQFRNGVTGPRPRKASSRLAETYLSLCQSIRNRTPPTWLSCLERVLGKFSNSFLFFFFFFLFFQGKTKVGHNGRIIGEATRLESSEKWVWKS